MSLRVGIDFDGTIADSQEIMCKHASARSRREIRIEDWKVYNPRKCFDKECAEAIIKTFGEPIVYKASSPYKGVEKINELNCLDGVEVEIWTALSVDGEFELKRQWLDRNGLGNININPVIGAKKSTKYDYIIEDCIEVLRSSEATLKVLIEKPWNRELIKKNNKEGIVVVKDFNEAIDIVLSKVKSTCCEAV